MAALPLRKYGSNESEFDFAAYKQSLAKFATGVAVVTTVGATGEPIGMTINSFASVSLNPPLVLWSLRQESSLYEDFFKSEFFVVNVLSGTQRDLVSQFSKSASDRFRGVESRSGLGGCKVLIGNAASFECRVTSRQQCGDHVIFIGEVEAFAQSANIPIVMHSGGFVDSLLAPPADSEGPVSGGWDGRLSVVEAG
jgi:flavin reductase (DIM6/NTAB) family NADH-FMN oxidoreductase RutF